MNLIHSLGKVFAVAFLFKRLPRKPFFFSAAPPLPPEMFAAVLPNLDVRLPEATPGCLEVCGGRRAGSPDGDDPDF